MSTRQIIIGMERWHFVGMVSREGDQVVITNGYNIRRSETDASVRPSRADLAMMALGGTS